MTAPVQAPPAAGSGGESFRYVWPCPSGTELDPALREVLLPGVEDARRTTDKETR